MTVRLPWDDFVKSVGGDTAIEVRVPLNVLQTLGLALEDGKSEEEQREMWGDAVVDWWNSAVEGDAEYKSFITKVAAEARDRHARGELETP